MISFVDSEEFERGLFKFVYEMDLPLVLSRGAHIQEWRNTFDYDDAENAFWGAVREGAWESARLDNALDWAYVLYCGRS